MRVFRTSDYNIGWLCALPVEEDAVIKLLDEPLGPPPDPPITKSGCLYNYGMIGSHRVVIRTLPKGSPDNAAASAAIHVMNEQFSGINHFLLSGIAGGLPGDIHQSDSSKNLHLGDVVIATPGNGHSGIINNTVHKTTAEGKELARMIDKTSATWRIAADFFVNKYNRDKTILQSSLELFPGPCSQDRLFLPESRHLSRRHQECSQCRVEDLVDRPARVDNTFPCIFQAALVIGGLIRDGVKREKISRNYPDARAVDMESSGAVEGFGSLVVRGISDYADAHKSDEYQQWAAGRAAAVAKAILLHVKIPDTRSIKPICGGDSKISVSHRLDIDYPLCQGFHGYDTVISFLEQSLVTNRNRRQQKNIVVLHGHAGSGKSAACDEFYMRNYDHFWGAWRINASSESNIMEGMLNVLEDLSHTELQLLRPMMPDPAKQVMQLLKNITKPWLFIFENADQNFQFISMIPCNEHGSTIITSRQPECCALDRSDSIAMSQINEDEAFKLFWFLINIHHVDLDHATEAAARAVVRRLHCFPMAIRVASSTIINDLSFNIITLEQSFKNYLIKLEDVPGPSHALQSLWGSPQNDGRIPYATMTSFSSLLDGIKRGQGASTTVDDAFELLDVFAFWSSGGISGLLLKAILQYQIDVKATNERSKAIDYFPNILKIGSMTLDAQMKRITQAIGLLNRFSLLTHINRGRDIEHFRWRMHPIFQECLRVSKFMSPEQGQKSIVQSLILLSCCVAARKIPNVRSLRRSVLPHFEAVALTARHLTEDKWFTLLFKGSSLDIASRALLNCSTVYFDSGNLLRAAEQQQYVYTKLKESDTTDQSTLWQAQSYLATSLHDLRNRSAAKILREELVRDIEAGTQGNLGASQRIIYTLSLADLADSYDMSPVHHSEVVPLRERVLTSLEASGSTSDVLFAKQRLARSCHLAGQETRALVLRKEVLEAVQHLQDRPEMKLDALGELAESLQVKGFWRQALNLRIQHESEASELFGPEHPDALAAKLNLAASLSVMDCKEEARQLRRAVYDSRAAALEFGADLAGSKLPHPMTLHALVAVARSERDCGEDDKAVSLLKQVMAAWDSYPSEVRIDYQEDHVNHKCFLAKLIERQVRRLRYYDLKTAKEYYRVALKHRQEVRQIQADTFGEDSKEVLLASAQVALTLAAIGDLHEAFENISRIVQKYKESFLEDESESYDKIYLTILRYDAEICERLASAHCPRLLNRSNTNTIPLEDIAPTLSASSSSRSLDSNDSMIDTKNGSDSSLPAIEPDTEHLRDSAPWQDAAVAIRRNIVNGQCRLLDRDSGFNQSALEDIVRLGSTLMRIDRAEALEFYKQVIAIMRKPERLGRSHSRIQELSREVEHWNGVLTWLNNSTSDRDVARDDLPSVVLGGSGDTPPSIAGSID